MSELIPLPEGAQAEIVATLIDALVVARDASADDHGTVLHELWCSCADRASGAQGPLYKLAIAVIAEASGTHTIGWEYVDAAIAALKGDASEGGHE